MTQPGVFSTPVELARVTPYGFTGDELKVKGEQLVNFKINGERYIHSFCMCSLYTDADGIFGTDFLRAMDATLDLKEGKLWLEKGRRVKHNSMERKQRESHGTASRAALTVFSATGGRAKQNSCMIGYPIKPEKSCNLKNENGPGIRISKSERWLVKTKESIRIPPTV